MARRNEAGIQLLRQSSEGEFDLRGNSATGFLLEALLVHILFCQNNDCAFRLDHCQKKHIGAELKDFADRVLSP